MTLPNLQSYKYIIQAGANVNYVENPANQAGDEDHTSFSVPANTNFQAVNLATYFPIFTTPQVLNIWEIAAAGAGIGFSISPTNSGTLFTIRPNGIISLALNSLPLTFYISNTNLTTPVLIGISLIGS